MNDVKNVITHLQVIGTWAAVGKRPEYRGIEPVCCEKIEKWIDEALDLIREQPQQEAVEPKQVDLYGKYEWYGLVCVCHDCKAEWMSDKDDTHFCPNCGRKVKWDA